MSIQCFLVEDLRRARYFLRRYSSGSKCPLPYGYHNIMGGVVDERPEDPSRPYTGTNPPEVDADDPRWPPACACGYVFTKEDTRQIFARGLYRLPDGTTKTWDEAPAGAMREAFWWPDKGADGRCWVVKLPGGGEWMTEQKAGNCQCPPDPAHRCWTRSGTAPELTVQPSIADPRWHGWLRDGILVNA